MRLPWKKSKSSPVPQASEPERRETPPSFGGSLEDFTVLRHHAVRALCGVLMDRHTACQSPHPFCNPGHWQNGDTPIMLIVQAVPQTSPAGGDLIGIYFCPASGPVGESSGQQDILEFITQMTLAQPVPSRKIVVNPPEKGVYPIQYGPIVTPVEGDYSTGRIDPENQRLLRSDPEPPHCRWQYWESGLTMGDWLVPTFHCLQVFGEWWVVDVDRSRGLAQQVAALDFADSPEHNFGIHSGRFKEGDVIVSEAESELAKVLQENWG